MDITSQSRDIALIGGSGFIGQHLLFKLLSAGHRVRIVDLVPPSTNLPEHAKFVRADVRNAQDIKTALDGCSLIYNLAAAHRDDVRPVSLYHEINVDGAANICAAARACSIHRIVFTSSVAIYGFQDGIPDESTPARPFNPYGETKWLAEKVFDAWQKEAPQLHSLDIVRPTVVFGPGNRGNVYNLIAQLASGFFVMIGSGENRKSMAFVENVAAFLAHLAELDGPGSRIYNYCDKPDLTMNELLTVVRKALGKSGGTGFSLSVPVGLFLASGFDAVASIIGRSLPISKVRVEKFCANTVFQADKLSATGFKPPFVLRDALLSTIASEFPR